MRLIASIIAFLLFGMTSAVAQDEFADGLSGGPDYWQVTGLTTGDTLNLRTEPSMQGAVVARLEQGEVLHNHGCRAGATRWCQVETVVKPNRIGWVAGRYLAESAPPPGQSAPVDPSVDAVDADTGMHATAPIDCVLSGSPGECHAGVVRYSGGSATLFIKRGRQPDQVIDYQNGRFWLQVGHDTVRTSKRGDVFHVMVGKSESYEIPEVLIVGD